MERGLWEVEDTRYFVRIDEKERNEERGGGHIFVVLCTVQQGIFLVRCIIKAMKHNDVSG